MERRKLSAAEANRAIGMLESGQRQVDVANHFHVSQSVISRLSQRYRETGNVSERPRSGRPVTTTPAQDRFLTISARREPLVTCRILRQRLSQATGANVSISTVRRRLQNVRLRSRRPLRRVPLSPEHKRQRLAWATERLEWVNEWRSVLFTDESRFGRYSDSRRVRVWTLPGTPRHMRHIQEVYPFRGGTVTVWGGICYNGKTDLLVLARTMTSRIYVDEVVNNILPQFHAAIGEHFQFLDDNARPHRAAIVLNALENHGIQHLSLPPRSPDLNPIEHAWDELQKALDRHPQQPATLQQLRDLLPQLWNEIAQEIFNHLVDSMQRRCQAVIAARGGHTRY